jgi:hypothetical protein
VGKGELATKGNSCLRAIATSKSPVAVARPRSATEELRILSGKLSPKMLSRPRWGEWNCERLRDTSTTIDASPTPGVEPAAKTPESIR